MFKVNVRRDSKFNVGDIIQPENLNNEYKEFNIVSKNKEELSENVEHIKCLIRGYFPEIINSRIENSIYSYLDKYFLKYFLSLSNLNIKSKNNHNFSKFYIGVNDDPSIITGIPIRKINLPILINKINLKIIAYLKQIQAFHKYKYSDKHIELNGIKYYRFNKLLSVIFRLFKVNIHILNKKMVKGKCVKKVINNIYSRQRNYSKTIKEYKKKKRIIGNLNYKYSQSLTLLLYNYELINIIGKFIKRDNPNLPFKNIHAILKKKLTSKETISQYIDNGKYQYNSIKDTEYTQTELNEYINIVLAAIRNFRNLEISKINKTKPKKPYMKRFNPLDSISSTILKINNFNNILYENDDIIQILIEIEIPIIKDPNAILGHFDGNCWKFPLRKIVKMGDKLSPITYN